MSLPKRNWMKKRFFPSYRLRRSHPNSHLACQLPHPTVSIRRLHEFPSQSPPWLQSKELWPPQLHHHSPPTPCALHSLENLFLLVSRSCSSPPPILAISAQDLQLAPSWAAAGRREWSRDPARNPCGTTRGLPPWSPYRTGSASSLIPKQLWTRRERTACWRRVIRQVS